MAFSRRDFFRFGLSEALGDAARAARKAAGRIPPPPLPPAETPTRRPPSAPPRLLRPPGAIVEKDFLEACTRCDACIVACPRQALLPAGREMGEHAEGTPIFVPSDQPCWLCSNLPCIDACQPGALRALKRADEARMGRVRLLTERCFSTLGSICRTCVDRCPVEPKPIMVESGRLPQIDSNACTGCGVCVWLCPAGAMEVIPRGGVGKRDDRKKAAPEAEPD
jgi:ferredoxin-type protein NapG